MFHVLRQQPVKLYQLRLFVNDCLRILVAFMDGLLQQAFDILDQYPIRLGIAVQPVGVPRRPNGSGI